MQSLGQVGIVQTSNAPYDTGPLEFHTRRNPGRTVAQTRSLQNEVLSYVVLHTTRPRMARRRGLVKVRVKTGEFDGAGREKLVLTSQKIGS